jgi:hypothetical protein
MVKVTMTAREVGAANWAKASSILKAVTLKKPPTSTGASSSRRRNRRWPRRPATTNRNSAPAPSPTARKVHGSIS